MSCLRWGVALAIVYCLLGRAVVVRAEDAPSPEALKNMYQTLKRDQDRISALAHDNEQLQAKVKELQKDLAAAETDKTALRRQLSDDAEKSYFLRSFHAVWESFVAHHPDILQRWQAYLGNDLFPVPQSDSFIDPNWPWSAQG